MFAAQFTTLGSGLSGSRWQTVAGQQDVSHLLSPLGYSLQLLEQQVVGGEQAKNKDLKEKHKRRKRYADERKKQLVAALQNSDEDSGDWVLLNVYDSIQEEVRAKSKLLEKMQRKVRPWLRSLAPCSTWATTLLTNSGSLLFSTQACIKCLLDASSNAPEKNV